MKLIALVTGTPGELPAIAVPGATSVRVHRPLTPPASETADYPPRPGVAAVLSIAGDELDVAAALAAAGQVGDSVEAYLVEERLQWDYDRTWPEGAPSPGLKQLSFIDRLPAITRGQFADHWSSVHTGLAAKHHPTIWRYVQNPVLERLTPDAPDIDGVAELHYRTYEDWRDRKFDSDEGKAVIRADVAEFIGGAQHVLSEETILLG